MYHIILYHVYFRQGFAHNHRHPIFYERAVTQPPSVSDPDAPSSAPLSIERVASGLSNGACMDQNSLFLLLLTLFDTHSVLSQVAVSGGCVIANAPPAAAADDAAEGAPIVGLLISPPLFF